MNCRTTNDNCKCDACHDEYYLENYQCLKCDDNCKTYSDTNTNSISCNIGYYLSSSNSCEECPNNCKECVNENACTSCKDNYFLYNNKCYECKLNCKTPIDNCRCVICNDGYYFKNYQCLKCDSNCKTCLNKDNYCIRCNTND